MVRQGNVESGFQRRTAPLRDGRHWAGSSRGAPLPFSLRRKNPGRGSGSQGTVLSVLHVRDSEGGVHEWEVKVISVPDPPGADLRLKWPQEPRVERFVVLHKEGTPTPPAIAPASVETPRNPCFHPRVVRGPSQACGNHIRSHPPCPYASPFGSPGPDPRPPPPFLSLLRVSRHPAPGSLGPRPEQGHPALDKLGPAPSLPGLSHWSARLEGQPTPAPEAQSRPPEARGSRGTRAGGCAT